MEWWLSLNRWDPSDAAGHIRLCCTPELQKALDARYTVAQWSSLTGEEALNAIKGIVSQPSNKAANWDNFFSDQQRNNETVGAFFTRTSQSVLDCEFACPSCHADLGDYLLLGKIITGLRETTLKREVFRICDTLTIDSLRCF